MSEEGPAAGARQAARQVGPIGMVVGVALMGALDEIVFHQLLQWHHFYLHTTDYWRTFSDGLFHAFTAAMWLIGVALLWLNRRRLGRVLEGRLFWAAVLVGMGSFQLFDGLVNHKILRLHPVRAGVENAWIYDAAWLASGVLLMAQGWILRRAAGEGATRT